jgi:hypothetical protein
MEDLLLEFEKLDTEIASECGENKIGQLTFIVSRESIGDGREAIIITPQSISLTLKP